MRISVSKLKCFMTCPFKFNMIYNQAQEDERAALTLGKAVHHGIETGNPDDAYEAFEGTSTDEYERVKASAMASAYLRKFGKATMTEQEFIYQFAPGVKIHGFVDGVEEDRFIEIKTSANAADFIQTASFDLQPQIYAMALDKPVCEYRVIQKPTIRPRQKETPEEWQERLTEWYAAEDRVHALVLDKLDIPAACETVAQIVRMMRSCQRSKVYPRNTQACYMCSFRNICDMGGFIDVA